MPVTTVIFEWKDSPSEAQSEPNPDHQSSRLGDDNTLLEVQFQNSFLSPMKDNETEPIHQADGDIARDRSVYSSSTVTRCTTGIIKERMALDAIPRQTMSANLVSVDASGSAVTPACMACYGANPSKLQLHATLDKHLPRLKPDSVVHCFMDYNSFRRGGLSCVDIKHTREALKRVIGELNSLNFRLKFKYVRRKDRSDFILAYDVPYGNRPEPNYFANAFHPDAKPDGRTIVLTSAAFKPEYRQSIFNILCHEFGHTVGMRHWDAATKEANWPSVQHPPGSDNKRSVMGPYVHPRELHFHPEDAEWLRDFYARAEGEVLYGHTIVDIEVN